MPISSKELAMRAIFSARLKALIEKFGIQQNELADRLGVSESTVGKWLLQKAMPRMGVIQSLSEYFQVPKSYFFEQESHSPEPRTVPSFEYAYIPEGVSAGSFEYAAPIEVLPRISVPDVLLGHYARNPRIVIMHVNGDSMNRIIDNGSAIAVLTGVQSECIQNGDVIIAYTSEGYTVKRFQNFPKEQCVMLYPDSTNPDFKPIVIPYDAEDGLRIFGKVVQYTVLL